MSISFLFVDNASANSGNEQHFAAYITGYGYWDNTPPGTSVISHPIEHRHAGGTGTYHDPITIAVGHSINGRHEKLDFRPGTMFYLRRLKKYAIVEDTCGDGPLPQNGPCHTGVRGHPWLDLYVGGKNVSATASARCQDLITAIQMVIMHPAPHYEVHEGDVIESGCKVF
ncbi:hypothetical protein [Marimonas lutisalis]|uniref:hypothetical protein n=1 Tax=Marimonas lutisalis TaxID=2545756 RepID=UPI001F423D61|nr:hypothetical protein [Marimonas lutisalis]